MFNLEKLKEKPFYLQDEDMEWVKNTFDSLSVEEKVGQLCGPPVLDSNNEALEKIIRFGFGGVYRFINMPTKDLIKTAKYLQMNSKIPLLMTGDFEFWYYTLTFQEGTQFPRQMGVAATNDPSMAEKMAVIAAREGQALGFNWSFSPVIDIDYNHRNPIVNTRSFGSYPDRIIAMAKAYIKGMQSEGMAATIKHWPGDGMDERNQHLVTSVNSMDMKNWRKTYGRIYKELIDAGAMSVMSAHITLPAYYKEKNPDVDIKDILPGSISKELNIDLLRDELGFNGVIVSDSLGMAGWKSRGRVEDLLPMVIENGCDVCLNIGKDISYLFKGLEIGKLSQKRLNEAVIRVLALKAALKLHKKQKDGTIIPSEDKVKSILGCQEYRKWAEECAEKSITLVKDTQNIIPITPDKYKRVLLIKGEITDFWLNPVELEFKKYLEEEGFQVTELQEKIKVDGNLFDLIIYVVAEEPIMVKPSISINWTSLHKIGKKPFGLIRLSDRYWYDIPTIFISLGTPYHLCEIPRVKTYINGYTPIEPVKKEVVQMLIGRKTFKGISPIDPFCGLEETRI